MEPNTVTTVKQPLLEVSNLSIQFGGLKAVTDFNLVMNENELFGIIGPNGAGKTTVFNMLTGIYRPTEGRIVFAGLDLTEKKAHEFTAAGIARTFQNIKLFNNLTVLDNIKIANHLQVSYGLHSAVLRTKETVMEEERIEQRSLEILRRLNLEEYAYQKAGNLSYGVQRRIEIARALATSPKLLFLDEPAAGMNPMEVDEMAEMIKWIRKEFGISILLIEHHMQLVMQVCEWIKVMNFGVTIAEGIPEEVRNNPVVVEAYLGKGGKI